ncbi:MAG: hypothetical protein JWQ44_2960 [Chthoniobacter sp.]|nr:hypothetical protein [Chthoniobacter sp.]
MTDFQINDYMLTRECDQLAQDIFDEVMTDAGDETAEDRRDTMQDRAHEAADGHEWVIYTFKAHMLCAHCNTDQGEAFLEDTGMPEEVTYDKLGTIIAYGEMRARIETKLCELIEAWEPAEAPAHA